MELWKSDGTSGGTVLVEDIRHGPADSYVSTSYFFTNETGTILYFFADDGVNGPELWKSDGTEPGTVLVKDINPGLSGSLSFFGLSQIGFGADIYFSATDGTGAELWKSDGTPTGTVLVKDISSEFFGSNPTQFLEFNNKLYFIADDGVTAYELWETDGTTAGTIMLKDINTAPGEGSTPILSNAIIIDGKFYFPATTAAEGNELWVSDGTTAGTVLFRDFNPGAGDGDPLILLDYANSSSMSDFHTRLWNGQIFLTANNGTNGT